MPPRKKAAPVEPEEDLKALRLALQAFKAGDFSVRLSVGGEGAIAEVARDFNDVVTLVDAMAGEIVRVAREVGTEGQLGGQAIVPGLAGTWLDLTKNVNVLAGNLTDQLRDVSRVATAIARGDLSQKMTVPVKGEILEIKHVFNQMVDSLNSFAEEVTRVAREVGTEGQLGGQAKVRGVSGTWKDLTDNVNMLAGNLTDQVRNIAKVTTAVANGDLTQKITVDAKGEVAELKNTINTMVDQLSSFADEVTRVAREVGTEGKLGGQANVKGVSGTWKDLTDNVNSMANNLTNQVRNIATVTTAVARGDLTHKITVDVRGEILELKNTINTMVDQLSSFADEVTRVAHEVGTEGKLGGQAKVRGVSGTWKDLTDNVNLLAGNLTDQVRNIATVTTAVAKGDLTQKITVDVRGEILELKNTVNTMVDQLSSFADEVTRVAREVGMEGKLGGQAKVRGVSGTWKDLTDNVNLLADNLTDQVRNIAKVTTAVAKGDLTQKITVDVRGEILELKNTINTMVDQLNDFAEEVTRVAREVGTEGELGGQAKVPGAAGTWRDLTDNVNVMASNLTTQVRNIARVVTAVANGDLKPKLHMEVKGEVATLAETINHMIDTLGTFAAQVTNVAREVGIEGKLGGQAEVPGAAGTWKDLTDNVNQLAANLTTQVRAIAEVSTAVTQGDLTQTISVEAQGEVAELKDNINQMIANLQESTRKTTEQDWLKSNIARLTGQLQGRQGIEDLARLIMNEVPPLVDAQYGAFYMRVGVGDDAVLKLVASYAFTERKHVTNAIRWGEGLVGQSALEKKPILLTQVPADYVRISSGLGEAPPLQLIVLPVLFEGEVMAMIELATLQAFSVVHRAFLEQVADSLGVVLNTFAAGARTEELLSELRQSNMALEEKARQLELKNTEIALASASLEDKAEQLALISKYKSDFLSTMSHELRTPLNSMLLLARLLVENREHTLTPKQLEYAQAVQSAGTDLLSMINEILDHAKIEAGKMQVELAPVALSDVVESLRTVFAPLAEEKGLTATWAIDPQAPATFTTDRHRLEQILRNLLSNAIKFTEHGGVTLKIGPAGAQAHFEDDRLASAPCVLAFSVVDTGIGIARDKQALVWEAFQQENASTTRRFGGTGLGLAISREMARLLGGEIQLLTKWHHGSTFTLYLPTTPLAAGPSEPPATLARRPGAVTFMQAEAPHEGERAVRATILAVGGGRAHTEALQRHLEGAGIRVEAVERGSEALEALERQRFDALAIALKLPDMAGLDLIERAREAGLLEGLPVIAHGAGRLSAKARERMAHDGIEVVPGRADVAPRLGAALERVLQPGYLSAPSSGSGRVIVEPGPDPLAGRVVLVVDDDVRNIFALTSLLESHQVKVLFTENGPDGIRALQAHPEVDLVLMDIMMPEMDGYEATRRIRALAPFRDLPVIALTAKAMRGDRERCLKAGASDYVAKPVDADRLLALMRRWVVRAGKRRRV